jgi:hypothetical protein
MSAPKWAIGMRRLQPGIYIDASGAINVDPPELCIAHGFAPTAANQAMLEATARRAMKEAVHKAEITTIGDSET